MRYSVLYCVTMKTKTVVDHFGSKRAVADALDISKGAVSQWGDDVPKLRAYELERITNGALLVNEEAQEPANAA